MARSQWAAMDGTNEKDIKFGIPEPFRAAHQENATNSDHLKRAMWITSAKDADSEFWEELSQLESKNEEDFSQFWIDRVTGRIAVYTAGLSTIEDAKLRSQLSELLCSYLQKELIPESIVRARSQGLTRSRKTMKNLQKFQSSVKQKTADLPSLVTATEKFNKKQSIQGPDENTITELKNTQVQDMIRKMQKQSEGPVLFLTLVVVLLARERQNLVYATGKFAPKLMKQLKTLLKMEDYEQLEKWKDLAKAGSLTADDKERMKAMAGGG